MGLINAFPPARYAVTAVLTVARDLRAAFAVSSLAYLLRETRGSAIDPSQQPALAA